MPESCDVRPVERGATVSLGENESIIFGRIVLTENGKPQIPYGLQTKPWWWLRSPPAYIDERKIKCRTIAPRTENDGTFVYIIPTGQYEVTHLRPFNYTPFIIPALEFSAQQFGVAFYIGDLEVDYDSTRLLGGLWGNYIHKLNYLEVVDRYDEVIALVADRVSTPTRKALMTRIRRQIPHLEEETGGMSMINTGTIRFGK
jgi:hypothetical protein